ncbi:uncharacterized protein LOC103308528 [Acyrthosiphon pisum]|uniref:DDE Tnp4 domain-containing protein n=1 Tax=Acyrthosiphon pisum TaxID=7029 RepID=A0A8R1X1I5_ACYPI|nr:uncharacterized protein LOC103308528 [Acyrthosiphon pisum]|eukprot:XP_008180264.1 PREDICTED: uncharacterized protein LOC103308528 [Acyrthosiphon pisum]
MVPFDYSVKYLSTGTNFVALQYEFLLGRSTIGTIIRETCSVLWTILQPKEMPDPNNPDKWLEIANQFYIKTNFPNCIGAVDGKHIRCINPKNEGTMFFNNYKKYFSIRESDSTVFKDCPFGKKLYSEELNLPAPTCLPNTTDSPQLFVIVADEAFGLHKNLPRPYPGRGLTDKWRIFNYRLSRARRIVKCTFGILANKWRVLHTPTLVEPDFTDIIVKTCCILHNYVHRRDGYIFEYTLSNLLEGIQNYGNAGAHHQGIDVRDYFAEYFLNAGSVTFQPRII